jgi:hypothetical protein
MLGFAMLYVPVQLKHGAPSILGPTRRYGSVTLKLNLKVGGRLPGCVSQDLRLNTFSCSFHLLESPYRAVPSGILPSSRFWTSSKLRDTRGNLHIAAILINCVHQTPAIAVDEMESYFDSSSRWNNRKGAERRVHACYLKGRELGLASDHKKPKQ